VRATHDRHVRKSALAGVLFVLLAPGAAHAYCRTTTCGEDKSTCEQSQAECLPVAWQQRCISYSLDTSNLQLGDIARELRVIERAAEPWMTALCPETGEAPRITLSHEWGTALCAHIEYNSTQSNANVITFLPVWPYEEIEGIKGLELGRTTATYNLETAEILDADIEINDEAGLSREEVTPDGEFDLQSVLTHEIGHFLGIAHTNVDESVMIEAGQPDETDRTLRADDISAICAVYAQPSPLSCDFTPKNGFTAECAFDPSSGGWCAAEPGRLPGRGAHLAIFVVGLAALAALRRRLAA